MNRLLTHEEYLRTADRLSAAPRILPRLLNVLSDPASDVSEVIELISFDPELTAKVLRTSNSAYVGLPEPARDVSEAVNLLGVAFIYELAAAACGAATFKSSDGGASAKLWQHSVTAALAAQLLSADLQLDAGPLFTAALLHDIGKAVFAEQWQQEYWTLIEQTRSAPLELLELEKQLFQMNHGELGGRLLAHWKFPSAISASVWHHHAPMAGMPFERETACVALANTIAESVTQSGTQKNHLLAAAPGTDQALAVFGLTPNHLQTYLARTEENFEFVDALCQMG